MAVIAGGRGSHRGLILGACSIMFLLEATRFLKDVIDVLDNAQIAAIRLILIGAGLIALLIYRPQGLIPEYRMRAPAGPRGGGDPAPDARRTGADTAKEMTHPDYQMTPSPKE